MHGARIPIGAASATFKHSRYSKYLPARLLKRFQEALDDEQLLEIRDEIAVVDARIRMTHFPTALRACVRRSQPMARQNAPGAMPVTGRCTNRLARPSKEATAFPYVCSIRQEPIVVN